MQGRTAEENVTGRQKIVYDDDDVMASWKKAARISAPGGSSWKNHGARLDVDSRLVSCARHQAWSLVDNV